MIYKSGLFALNIPSQQVDWHRNVLGYPEDFILDSSNSPLKYEGIKLDPKYGNVATVERALFDMIYNSKNPLEIRSIRNDWVLEDSQWHKLYDYIIKVNDPKLEEKAKIILGYSFIKYMLPSTENRLISKLKERKSSDSNVK